MEVGFVFVLVLACPIAAAITPVIAAVVIGKHGRSRLEQEIAAGEQRVAHLLTVTTPELGPGRHVTLVLGTVVYAPDGAARMAHRWRRLVGGRSTSMTQRMESARRLATVRALEHASQLGAQAVLNLRYQTSELHEASLRSQRRPVIEVIAYGTAWVPASVTS